MAGENFTMFHATVESDLCNYIWVANNWHHGNCVVRESGEIWKALWEGS